MHIYKLSNRLYASARVVITSYPVSTEQIETLVNDGSTSGNWEVTSKLSDWSSDYSEESKKKTE